MEPDKPTEAQNLQQQSQATEIKNAEEKPKNTKKRIFIALGLLLIIALFMIAITGAYWYGVNSRNTNNLDTATTTTENEITVVSNQEDVALPTIDPETSSWLIYDTNKYNYSIKYAPNDITGGGAPGLAMEAASNFIIIENGKTKPGSPSMELNVLDPEIYSSQDELYKDYNLNVEDFATKIRMINEEDALGNPSYNKTVGVLKKTTIDGQPAFSFTINHSFKSQTGGTLLEEEYIYIFTADSNGLKYSFDYPTSNEHLEKVVSTFKFSK